MSLSSKYRTLVGDVSPKQGSFDSNLTFSGCDIIPVIAHPVYNSAIKRYETRLFVVGDIATLTYSIHQDKGAVRTLGRSAPRGFVRGPETVAGTMIFNVLERQAMYEISNSSRDSISSRTRTLPSLPSFDIILYFSNEAGHTARLGIFGVQIIDEGQSHSVEDTYVENTAQYLALRVEPLDYDLPALSSEARFISTAQERAKRGLGRSGLPFDYTYFKT